MKTLKLGTIRKRFNRSKWQSYIKTETGWKLIPKVKKKKTVKVVAKKAITTIKRTQKPSVKKFPNRVEDMNGKRFIRTDCKTWRLKKVA